MLIVCELDQSLMMHRINKPVSFGIAKIVIQVLVICSSLGIAFFLTLCHTELQRQDYDWDTDHEMYFASRLLSGELIWTKEIHDKLPVVQLVFLIPAYYSSVSVWVMISIVISILSLVSFFLTAYSVAAKFYSINNTHTRIVITFLVTSYFAFCLAYLASSFSHIYTFTAALTMIVLCSRIFAQTTLKCSTNLLHKLFFWVTLICASIVVSFRPYLGPSFLAFELFFPNVKEVSNHDLHRIDSSQYTLVPLQVKVRYIFVRMQWITYVALTVIFLNFAPYIFLGEYSALLRGIYHNSQQLYPSTLSQILTKQFQKLLL